MPENTLTITDNRTGKIYTVPAAPTMVSFLVQLRFRALMTKVRDLLVTEQWRVGIRRRSALEPWDAREPFRFLKSPEGHFYADPFVVVRDGRTFIFFEDFVASVSKGRICDAVLVMTDLIFSMACRRRSEICGLA